MPQSPMQACSEGVDLELLREGQHVRSACCDPLYASHWGHSLNDSRHSLLYNTRGPYLSILSCAPAYELSLIHI